VNCRLANRVLVPEAIPAERLARFGAKGDKLVQYPGLKEEYYLHGFEPDAGLPERLGVTAGAPLAVVRTPPAYALYLGGAESALLPRVLLRLADGGAQTVVLPRTPEQADAVDALGIEGVHVPRRAVDGRSLVALADLLVSAGGTMNREAAVLGTPVWSMFEGELGAVDELLVHQGRLRILRDPDDIVVAHKDAAAVPALRDPAALLRLALPWVS
jgi:predicted glycosyltransferase